MASLFALVTIVSFGQSNQILSDGSKWFKEKYVDANFKDPYSYKELKIELDSLSNYDFYKKNSDSSFIALYEKYSMEYKEKYEKESSKRKPNETLVNIYKKSYDEYSAKLKNAMDASEKLKLLSEDEKKQIYHYIVKIDSHANNSYGNPVLGRYRFTYKKGSGFDLGSIYKAN